MRLIYRVQQYMSITEVEFKALATVCLLLVAGLAIKAAPLARDMMSDPETEPLGMMVLPPVPTKVSPMAPDTVLKKVAPPDTLSTRRGIGVNTASEEELQRLVGIGPALASRIVAYRAKHGPFRRLRDLRRVKGIGPKKLERIKQDAGIH